MAYRDSAAGNASSSAKLASPAATPSEPHKNSVHNAFGLADQCVAEVLGGASLGSPCDFILATGPTADTPQLQNPNEALEHDANFTEILAVRPQFIVCGCEWRCM